MRVALAQINTTIGDLEGNVDKMIAMSRQAAERQADVVVFPELAVVGYPPRDLLEKPVFYERAAEAERRLAEQTATLNLTIIYGTVGMASG
ncbi:MAG: NAD+ synthase, partial [Thermoleophilia bacterium]|nr:NAD+ synthase [Thermoleophilia bacterium]